MVNPIRWARRKAAANVIHRVRKKTNPIIDAARKDITEANRVLKDVPSKDIASQRIAAWIGEKINTPPLPARHQRAMESRENAETRIIQARIARYKARKLARRIAGKKKLNE